MAALLLFQRGPSYIREDDDMLQAKIGNVMVVKLMTAVAVFLVTGVGLYAQASPAAKPGSIQGTVLGEDGQALTGATVFAFSDLRGQFRATTDANGKFVLTGVPAGDVYLDAFKESDGYPYNFFAFYGVPGRKTPKVSVTPGMQTQGVVIKLGPKAATLHLDITQADGSAVNGAVDIEFTRDDVSAPYSEGARIHHTMFVPSNVPFRFSVTVPGYKPWNSDTLTAQESETLNISVHLSPQ
jgi:Carboxypeptidase regulatory-like domain